MAHMSPRLKMRRGRFGLGGFKEPTLVISGPGGILLFGPGSPLTIGNFTGSSTDDLQGDLSANITWSVHGPGSPSSTTFGSPIIITGASVDLSSSLAELPGSPQFVPSTFTVVARVADSGGNAAVRSLAVTVETAVDYVPNLTFVSPATGSVFGLGSPGGDPTVPSFVATAIDHEDGDISANVVWSVHGPGSPAPTTFGSPILATGASVDLSGALSAVGSPVGSPIPVGSPGIRDFTIVAQITDTGGNVRRESITIQVVS